VTAFSQRAQAQRVGARFFKRVKLRSGRLGSDTGGAAVIASMRGGSVDLISILGRRRDEQLDV